MFVNMFTYVLARLPEFLLINEAYFRSIVRDERLRLTYEYRSTFRTPLMLTQVLSLQSEKGVDQKSPSL